MSGRPKPMNDDPGGDYRQGAKEKLEIGIPGKKIHLPGCIESCQCSIANYLQMMELQVRYPHGTYRFQGEQHILLALAGNSEDQMDAKGKTTCCLNLQCSILEIGKAVMAIEKLQTPFMNTL